MVEIADAIFSYKRVQNYDYFLIFANKTLLFNLFSYRWAVRFIIYITS